MPRTQKTKRSSRYIAIENDVELDGSVDDKLDDTDEPLLEEERASLLANPDNAAAYVLVDKMLKASPGSLEIARRDGVAVIIEVESDEWVDPVAEACRILIRRSVSVPEDADTVHHQRGYYSDDQQSKWFEFRRNNASPGRPTNGNAGVHRALNSGRSVYGFSPSPDRYLPPDLIRIADLRLVLPPMDAAALVEMITLVVGKAPTTAPATSVTSVTLDDLNLARRPNQTADEYLAKICALITQKTRKPSPTLDVMHGMDEAVRWGRDLAHDLEDYRRGILAWSAVDRGVLLYGPPGTGKTTFARALAASCNVPLFSASLSQWQAAGHLGDLLKAMRRTFADARKAAPSILFVDEVDSFGDRNELSHEHRDYAIQVINAFLEELDGIGTREGVVVIAACNDPKRLDPAIVRSGRLDRAITIPLPDAEALAKILRHHLGTDLPGANLRGAALLAMGSTGADCERWIRTARRHARHARRDVTIEDLISEISGSKPQVSPDNLRRCAIHEAGHALVAVLKRPPGSLQKVSIQQSDGVGGSVVATMVDSTIATRAEMETTLHQLLAGRAAEEVVLGEASGGAGGDETSDLAKATSYAVSIVCSLGLDDEGLLWMGVPNTKSIWSMLAMRPDVTKRVSAMLADSYGAVVDLIRSHRSLVEQIAEILLTSVAVSGKEIEELVRANVRTQG